MSKLVAHEVEVSLSSQRQGDEADHLVEGNAAVDAGGGRAIQCHEVVHVLVGEEGWGGREGGRGKGQQELSRVIIMTLELNT